jgi:quercetin dioxygenase-like cupin family protein
LSDYFSTESGGTPTAAGHWVDLNATDLYDLAPGIRVRAVTGHECMVTVAEFDRGAVAPRHAHGEEQIVLVMQGEMEFDLDGDVRRLRAGESVVVPAWVPHAATCTATRAVTVETFSPPRAGLLALLGEAANGPTG